MEDVKLFIVDFLEKKFKNDKTLIIKTMIGVLLVSGVLMTIYTIVFPDEGIDLTRATSYSSKESGFTADPLTKGVGTLFSINEYKKEIEIAERSISAILSKEVLTKQDSIELLNHFETLENINNHIKKQISLP